MTTQDRLDRWEHRAEWPLAAVAAAMLPFRGWLKLASGWAFVLSVVLFSGVQILKIMMAGIPVAPTPLDGFTFLVPVGGVAFIVGWLLMGLSAATAEKPVLREEENESEGDED